MRCSGNEGYGNVRRMLAAGLAMGLALGTGVAKADDAAALTPKPLADKTGIIQAVSPLHRPLSVAAHQGPFEPRSSVVLYTSNTLTSPTAFFFNVNAASADGTVPGDATRVTFDDIPIPSARLGATTSGGSITVNNSVINVCKVTIGIRRGARAVATDVKAYWSTASTVLNSDTDTNLDTPPTQFGLVHLAANGATAGTAQVVYGVSNGPTLFSVPLNFGIAEDGTLNAGTIGLFTIGVALSDTASTSNQGWALSTGPDANFNVFWVYDPAHTSQDNDEGAYLFGDTPNAAFYVIVEGTPVAPPSPVACCVQAANSTTACYLAPSAAQCTAGGGALGGGTTCSPNPCLPPPNDTCANATALPLTGASISGTNQNATIKDLPGCGFNLVDGPAVFYKFTGTGNDVTISTCDAATALNTVLHVYCSSNGCAGPLNCAGGNDDDTNCLGSTGQPTGASTVTIPTTAGNQYYVVVNGFQGATGSFNINALDTGAASTNPPTCASLARCVVDNDPFDFAESDACGTNTSDTNGTCATATPIPALGMVAKGTLSTDGAFRDFDLYQIPAAASGGSVGMFLRSETPTLVQFLNDSVGDCSTLNVVPLLPDQIPGGAGSLVIAPCLDINDDIFDVTLPAGTNYVLVTPPSFNGDPCGTGPSSQNDYRLKIDITPMGACCAEATQCFTSTLADCASGGGIFWFESTACSLGNNSVDPCTVTVGTCCLTNGTCQFVPSTSVPTGSDCTTQGGTFAADDNATCSPSPCAPAPSGVCCRGSTCNTTVAQASCAGSGTAGAVFVSSSSTCNSGAVSHSPCCYADFNKANGVTVQDIFDFLAAWFAGNPYAKVGGDGTSASLSVQNIFDFLSDWFGGGCS